jgi:hypothetical protein
MILKGLFITALHTPSLSHLPSSFMNFYITTKSAKCFNTLPHVGVTFKMGFWLDDWIYCTLYIHTTQDYRQCSAIADLHTLQFIVLHTRMHAVTHSLLLTHSLALSLSLSLCLSRVVGLQSLYPGSGFITVSLSLQITHEVFFCTM